MPWVCFYRWVFFVSFEETSMNRNLVSWIFSLVFSSIAFSFTQGWSRISVASPLGSISVTLKWSTDASRLMWVVVVREAVWAAAYTTFVGRRRRSESSSGRLRLVVSVAPRKHRRLVGVVRLRRRPPRTLPRNDVAGVAARPALLRFQVPSSFSFKFANGAILKES